jgi:hypothetical protein
MASLLSSFILVFNKGMRETNCKQNTQRELGRALLNKLSRQLTPPSGGKLHKSLKKSAKETERAGHTKMDLFLPARACNARAGLHSAFCCCCCCCWCCGGGGGCFTQLLRISSWLHVE